ncbi:MAG: alpha/beta hydrolase [Faecousia sp.]
MTFLLIFLCLLLLIALGGGYYAYRVAFYSPKKDRDKISAFSSHKYDPYRKEINRIFCQLSDRPCEDVTTQSFDGLNLMGRYYHVRDGAPLDIGFHGYRSSALTDFAGGSELSFAMGHNLLLIDERAHGKSGGRTIAFGIQERLDAASWVNYAVNRFGADTKILLYGVSMGAATVLMASELDLPENVKGIIADCPYSSPKAIIRKVAKDMHLPDWLAWPFVKIGAKIYGGFDIDETDAARAVKNAHVPILIIHGEDDGFVPCEMSDIVSDNPKLVTRYTFPGADHGFSYLVDTSRYRKIVTEFVEKVL